MDTASTTPTSPSERYPDGSMQVEQGATPDGRLLLYFTFPTLPSDETRPPERGAAGSERGGEAGSSTDV